ncbi:adenosylcobinamide-phosphate synthase CbiB [Desulforhopalus singaporensis]|uniref:Cobalamin biosynthesis protein CobD n=1 Tax=Desulforhopalus singaporensis TaxID=91360 RepID=A0A1H0PIR3_9BACT|nr:adenosylcobinamide-phosphate synthase CbiB [Desulforhopalus singaporensis]SDP04660.1 adenosylcobinamide-phosphate synthase [Desulforhopalus singaporensis]
MTFVYFLAIAISLDLLIGDPSWYPHPVRGVGWLIGRLETICRFLGLTGRVGGGCTVFFVVALTLAVILGVLSIASLVGPVVEAIAAIFIVYTAIACRDLIRHSLSVYRVIRENSLEQARKEVAKIVGRDTSALSEEDVARACVETVAENMVDGITAPLFFAVVFSFFSPVLSLSPIACGAVGAYFYKSINTMDSMIGYKNERYLEFGRYAAKIDDIVNFIPARLSGLCLIAASFMLRLNYRDSARIFFRDRLNHASPNAAHPEAAVAGALGVRLGGANVYFDKIVEKPFIGEKTRTLTPEDIKTANRLVVGGSAIFVMIIIGCGLAFGQWG